MTRTRLCTAVVAAAIAVAALPSDAATTVWRWKRTRSSIESVVTPLGVQGVAGAGGNVVMGFTVSSRVGRRTEVQVQYGIDRNADGLIDDDEFRPATEDRLDPRDTRSDTTPQLFATGPLPGTPSAFVWNSLADVGTAHHGTMEYALTPQGRYIPDPDNPGAFLFATGPGGTNLAFGFLMRARTVWGRTKRGWRHASPWTNTGSFEVDNANAPSMTIDTATSGATVTVGWTAYDANSEDLNGNGQLDLAGGEDVNGNGILDCESLGVAFDFHRLADGEDPAAMSDGELSALQWSPCTRLAGVGDTDSLDARPGVPVPTTGDLAGLCSAPPGVGRHWHFAWDAVGDVGVTTDGFIVRATPFCEHRKRGSTVYSRIVVTTAQ